MKFAMKSSFGAVAAATFASATLATDRLVPQEYPTIQAAINASTHGDRVLVAPGTYVESINFAGKAIEVAPLGDSLSATLRAPPGQRAVTFSSGESPKAVLRGFELVGCLPEGSLGGGIFVSDASPTFEGCVVSGIRSAISAGVWSGAVTVVSGSPTLRNCVLENNRGLSGDGGALLVRGGVVSIVACTFRDNPGGQGGDLFIVNDGRAARAALADCVFEGSSGAGFGARIYNYGQGESGAIVSLSRCVFRGIQQPAISLVHGWDTVEAVNVTFQQCIIGTPSGDYSALFTQSRSTLTVTGSRLEQNSAFTLFVADPAQGARASIADSAFCGNTPVEPTWAATLVDAGGNSFRTSCCAGDVTRNGSVDGVDLAAVLGAWGGSGGKAGADINGDGLVDGADLAYVLGNWGPCPG